MNRFLHGVARAVAETFDLPGPILEIGAYQVPGQEDLADLRPFFPGREYLGLDAQPGRGVDEVADVEDLPFDDASVGTVLAFSTFEHVPRFWKGFAEIERVLRPDGALVVSCPFYFHIHGFPHDFWRFTPEAFSLLLEPYPSKLFGWHGPKTRPADVWAVAFREDHPPIREEEFQRYRELLSRYAREPLPWSRRLRYQLGRLLCGSRPFAPWLLRDRWESSYVNEPVTFKRGTRSSHAEQRRLPAKG